MGVWCAFTLACLATLPLVALSKQARPGPSAVPKVVRLLTDMSATAKKERQDEETEFARFATWCSEETVNLKREIKTNGEEIDVLAAGIGKLKSEIKETGQAIGQLASDISTFEADSASGTAQRKKDHAEFQAESTDFDESVDAIDRAITVLQRQNYDRPATQAALLQLSDRDQIPNKVKSIVAAFLGMMDDKDDGDFMTYQAPEANAYEAHSSNIIEVLKKLQDQFRSQLATSQKEEMNSKHASDMVYVDLQDSIKFAKRNVEEKKIERERKMETAAMDEKQLAGVASLKEENEKVLSDMAAECSEKKFSFDEKQKLRVDEIEALEKAIEILSSPDVAFVAETYGLAQANPAATMFISISRHQEFEEGVRHRIREFIAAEGQRLKSQKLMLLADSLAANPFAKVKRLIDDLITRLLEEANKDADHEGFCDTEMGKSKITRDKLTGEIDALDAAVEEGKAMIMTLATNIAEFRKEVSELLKARSEAEEIRQEESTTNAATIKDAQSAQAAVSAATAVLKEFYEKALKATAMLQGGKANNRGVTMGSAEWNSLANPDHPTVDRNHKEGMQTFGATYKGQQEESGQIFALLEIIQSDFANLEADTRGAEQASQKTFERNMVEWKRNEATKTRQIEMNDADKSASEAKLRNDIADLKATQDELLAAERYHERLVPKCVDQGMTHEEVMKARQAEIDSLKKALEILNNEVETSVL